MRLFDWMLKVAVAGVPPHLQAAAYHDPDIRAAVSDTLQHLQLSPDREVPDTCDADDHDVATHAAVDDLTQRLTRKVAAEVAAQHFGSPPPAGG